MRLMVLRFINLWLAFFRNSLSRDMEYKMNFIMNLFIDAIFYGSYFFLFSVIFSYVDSLGDFSKEENEEFEKIQTKIVKNFDLLIDTNIKKFQSNMK